MPPREAIGGFADQYLSYDYEAAALAQQQQQQQQQTLPPVPPLPLHNSTTLTQTTTATHDDNASPHHTEEASTEAAPDPLSIDPTLQQFEQSPNEQSNVSVQVASVLDTTTSLESDDDDDDDEDDDDQVIPDLHVTLDTTISSTAAAEITDEDSSASSATSGSLRLIQRNSAFSMEDEDKHTQLFDRSSPLPEVTQSEIPGSAPLSPNSIFLSFGPQTTVQDLKYFAERGCIVALLEALTTPRLQTLGTRMLADYAKLSERRVAVASNRRILQFLVAVMNHMQSDSAREYAVETIRSLTATEESDSYLMSTEHLVTTLALVARGGPFVTHIDDPSGVRTTLPLASEKARLHACIAIMNLSCGKANKIEIAKLPQVLESMRDVMVHGTEEARLKATTCIKNLSNADANDYALLSCVGLVEALGLVAKTTCDPSPSNCTTNACLALMNLSISKSNKHVVFQTPGVMDALMTVLDRTSGATTNEARIKACSALSNLAIGYDNKIPMFRFPGFVDAILKVIQTDTGEARTKACSILWSFAAEMKNQVPVVKRGDILPVLVRVAEEDGPTEARFKCVAALTLLAESLDNAIPLLESGALAPLMDILHEAGPDPTQWKGQTASWCVGFLMNIAQSDEAVPALREAGVVELLLPLLTLDHYQSLKAAMAVTFVCRYDEGDETYDLLRKTENVIPKIISLLHNTLSGRGGNGYKYGVFTLRSSVGCIASLASGPEFMKERIATGPVFESLLRVVSDFCVDGGTPGAIVGGGREDALSATLAVRALAELTGHLIPVVGTSALPFQSLEDPLMVALHSFATVDHDEIKDETRLMALDALKRIQGGHKVAPQASSIAGDDVDMVEHVSAAIAGTCCGLDAIPMGEEFFTITQAYQSPVLGKSTAAVVEDGGDLPVRTFLLTDARTGRRFCVPVDPSGGRSFYDSRVWCYRRGRFCLPGEEPDSNFEWNSDLQQAYETALLHGASLSSTSSSVTPGR
uniref:Vacuolar protein 8 n=1 Tax=Grammatophora oceanica TaxID=210454 RepID=A0A7S1VJ79_9STRA|mmetsp:Transcript_46472/g.69174  ORF Transcript_46472/g.69174 Transcript_46472/m.69174 type:complete len:985 (+) Transcript_46472:89-3043(+)